MRERRWEPELSEGGAGFEGLQPLALCREKLLGSAPAPSTRPARVWELTSTSPPIVFSCAGSTLEVVRPDLRQCAAESGNADQSQQLRRRRVANNSLTTEEPGMRKRRAGGDPRPAHPTQRATQTLKLSQDRLRRGGGRRGKKQIAHSLAICDLFLGTLELYN